MWNDGGGKCIKLLFRYMSGCHWYKQSQLSPLRTGVLCTRHLLLRDIPLVCAPLTLPREMSPSGVYSLCGLFALPHPPPYAPKKIKNAKEKIRKKKLVS